mmetsp:Transcript_19981/g.27954  ORF Transcript_19981/g.27954 Transcript_19981/m.27954 type:complete len:211 (+) Transcript_19981:70-702(+)
MSEMSSQSQEAMTAVENELTNILNKGKRKKQDDEEASQQSSSDVPHSPKTTKTDHKSDETKETSTEIKPPEAKRSLTESQQISWYFSIDLNDPSNSQNDNSPPSSQSNETNNNTTSRPTMQRTKSLEAIGKNPPSKVIKVCVEKTTFLLTQEPVDYKKVKYWLKIAFDVASSIGKEKDFNEFLKKLHNAHKSKSELEELITTSFPNATLA